MKKRNAPIMNNFIPEFWQSPTGANLAVRQMHPTGRPKAIVHVNHGMAEHSARYERFARALSKAGYLTIAHDHRGHGMTTAPDAPLGTFSNRQGLDKVIADMKFVNGKIHESHPGIPRVFFGHSMGAIFGVSYCSRHSDTLNGAVLWNLNVDGGMLPVVAQFLLKIERAFKGSDVPSRIALKLSFEDWNAKFKPNRTDFDWISSDEKEVDKYVADPLCGFPASVGLWLDMVEVVRTGARNSELEKIAKTLPFHLLGGSSDPLSNFGKSITRFADRLSKVGIQDITSRIIADTRHETLNDIKRDEATAGLIDWLDERFG